MNETKLYRQYYALYLTNSQMANEIDQLTATKNSMALRIGDLETTQLVNNKIKSKPEIETLIIKSKLMNEQKIAGPSHLGQNIDIKV